MLDFIALVILGVFILPFKGIDLMSKGNFSMGIPVTIIGFVLWSFFFNW